MITLKTTIKRAACFVLVIILTLVPALSVGGLAVTYPEGVTQADCETAIPKLDKVIPAAVQLTGKSLDETVYGTIITDATLNSLFKSVYSEMTGNASTLNMMGVDLSPAALASALSDYPSVSSRIAGLGSLEDVLSVCDSFQWGVSTKSGFAWAVAAMFSPFNNLLNAILCGGTAQINLLLAIKGDDGYGNTVVPLLRVLNCPSIMSSSEFAAQAQENRNNIVRNIVSMLFSAVDNLLSAPGTGICSTLPALAWYIHSGKLSAAVKSLTDPLALRIGIVTIPGITSLLGSIADLESMDLSSMIGNIDISKMTGGENAALKLPEMDMGALAACGKETDGTFTPDQPAALITVMNWLVKTVKLNGDSLTAQNEDAKKLAEPLLAKSDDELVRAILLLLGVSRGTFTNPFKWTYPEYHSDEILSTPNLTMDDYALVLQKIDPFLDEVAAEKNEGATIRDTLQPVIYSNSLLGTIVSALYGALNGEQTASLMPVLGLDASPSGVASAITYSHPAAAETLRRISSWEQLTATSIDFGFENGDRDGFKKALADVLSPFETVFRYLLAEGTITILGGITLDGADGYNTVIIPILEALGCPASSIKTYAQYRATAGDDAVTDIIEPVLSLLDAVCEKPVETVCAKLPNIVYFLYNDGLKNCLSNLLYPITAKLEQVGLSGVLSGDLFDTSALDVDSAVNKLLTSSDLKLQFVTPNLRRLESFGKQTTAVSKRTVDGGPTVYTYIEANGPAVLLTILRYFVNTISLEQNKEVLSSFMTSLMESQGEPDPDKPDMMAMYAGSIGQKFEDMTTDEIIEWLYDLLFRETPKVEEDDGYIPTIIYKKERQHHPGIVIAVLVVLLVIAFIVLRYLDKRKKFEKFKEKRRTKKQAKLEALNAKRAAKGKPPKAEKAKKAKPQKTKVSKAAKKNMTPQEKLAAKNAAKEQKLRAKALKSAKPPQKHTPAAPAAQAAPAQTADPVQTAPQRSAQTSPPQTAQRSAQPAQPQYTAQPRYTARQPAQDYPQPQRTQQGYAPGAPAGRGANAPARFEASRTMSQKQADQLNKAQTRAAKEAKKNQMKTERIYAKAMKDAGKNGKGGRS